jgi:hypothetical protein
MAMNSDYTSSNTMNKEIDLDQKLASSPNRDAEKGATGGRLGTSNKSAGGRIAPVLPHLQGYDFGDDDAGSDILGKQIELEAGNEIQYRTCSWPKVCYHFYVSPSVLLNRSSYQRKFPWHGVQFGYPNSLLICDCRPLRYSSQSISVWLSCPSHIATPSSVLSQD